MSREEMVTIIKADTSQYEAAMKKVGEEPSKAANRARSGFSAMNKFMEQTQRRAEILGRIKASPAVQLVDRISGPIRKIEANLGRLSSTTRKVTIEAIDKTSGVVKRITGALTSPLGLLSTGVGVYGIGKLTLGAAMDFETQMVSMEHWLKGNKELAKEYTGWLDQFANKTPFEMEDLFPAGSRAIGISEGNLNMAERLVKLSANMAGLTPGKTIQDATEALADAQMGEFERLKEFNMKFSKEQMDAVGGFAGFLQQAEAKFAGGAEKLSATAKGRISTITDFIKTQFRSAGQGMLESLNPRLQKITDWFDKNQDTVTAWKGKLVNLGRETFEGMLSWGEGFLGQLKAKLDDPGFEKLDWGGKLGVMMDTAASIALPKAGEIGVKIGLSVGSGILSGLSQAANENKLLGLIIAAYAGSKMPGPPVVKIAVAGATFGGMMINANDKLDESGHITEGKVITSTEEASGLLIDTYTPSVGGFGDLRAKGYATGGILNRPHLGLVAEAGPEAIIPLSSRIRSRALDLWQDTGRRLGVKQYAFGGFAGNIPSVAYAGVGAGVNLSVQADVGINLSSSEIDFSALATEIGWRIVEPIKKALENRT